jgi:hypothetical protein
VNPPRAPDLLRALCAALAVFALALLCTAAWRAWRESQLESWSALGLDWLAIERFGAERPYVPALVAAVLSGLLLVAARRAPVLARFAADTHLELLGHPLCVGFACLLAFVLPGVVVRGTRPVPARQAPNVLFILIDTWRADHAGFLGYARPVSPELDALAAQGVVFERALSQSSWTKPAVATLLTGLTPSQHHAVSQAILETPVRGFNLNPRLTTHRAPARTRWQTAMWSDNPNITPPVGFGQGAESFRDYFHQPATPRTAGASRRSSRTSSAGSRRRATPRDPSASTCTSWTRTTPTSRRPSPAVASTRTPRTCSSPARSCRTT